jgi:hypothetical protein
MLAPHSRREPLRRPSPAFVTFGSPAFATGDGDRPRSRPEFRLLRTRLGYASQDANRDQDGAADVGCGPGAVLVELACRAGTVTRTAIDQ